MIIQRYSCYHLLDTCSIELSCFRHLLGASSGMSESGEKGPEESGGEWSLLTDEEEKEEERLRTEMEEKRQEYERATQTHYDWK